ncbi:1-phosphofructokinase family hexose kinase [Arthrobacter sp. KN11-1C]|uniref:1-phosphofructokinase family hexose kinase n=1 Tax=Arthrobacter sp. KN11-1C TaxID=3445774 RepID=UPI003FA1221F
MSQIHAPSHIGSDDTRSSTSPRVVTLTPAPAIDKVYFLDRVRAGQVNRAKKVATYFAGNGVNVARTLWLAGSTVSAVLPAGHEDPALAGCDDDGFMQVVRGVDVGNPIRTNVILVDKSGTTTNVNAHPAPLAHDQWARICQAATDEVQRINADWFVLGGALPIDTGTGAPVDVRPLFRAMHSLGVRVSLDTAIGKAPLEWAKACQPDLVKPNAAELTAMAGIPIRSLRDAEQAAALVRARGINTVLASLGPDGILEVGDHGTLWARGPEAQVINTTGAGDAALAGYLSVPRHGNQWGRPHDEALRRAVSWGALAVEQATTMLPHIITNPTNIRVGPPERDHQLS